jgi:hypothetical protein
LESPSRSAALIVVLLVFGFYGRSLTPRRLTEKDTIVLADFTNTTGDAIFDDALKQALAAQLVQYTSKARRAYQDFLALWKDADPDIAILQQAKAEYAKLGS